MKHKELKMRIFFCLIISLTALLSCNQQNKGINTLLQNVEILIETNPDSALILLDSIRNPYELTEEQNAEYQLLLIQAKDKNYKDISSDTAIFQLKDFDFSHNKPVKKALVQFYSGRVLQSQGKSDKAAKAYLEAETLAKEIENINLIGAIEFFLGELNYYQNLQKEAIIHFKQSAMHFSELENKYKNEIIAYNYIGNSFLIEELPDSAFFYYDKGLALSEVHKDSIEQVDIMQNMGVLFLELGKPQQAKDMLFQALPLSSNDIQRAKIYLNLAQVFHSQNELDSVSYYSNLSLKFSEENKPLHASIFELLSHIEAETGNFQKGLEYCHKYIDNFSSIVDEKRNSKLLEIQKKYNYELLQNANNKLLIEKQWLLIGFILFGSISIFIIYWNRSQNKKASLLAKQQIYQLKEMIIKKDDDENSNNNQLRNILNQQLKTFKKISLLEGYLREEEKEQGKETLKKVNEIIYGTNEDFDWNIFYQPVNALYDNYLEKLKSSFPKLTENGGKDTLKYLFKCNKKEGVQKVFGHPLFVSTLPYLPNE